jgi:hypothetical protein
MAVKRNVKDQAKEILLEVPFESDLPARIVKISEQTGLSPLNLFQKWVLQEESLIGVLQNSKDRSPKRAEAHSGVSRSKAPVARKESAKADLPVPKSPDYRKTLAERAIKLKKEGMTLKKIAEIFNEEKAPTVSGTGKWYASSIINLLKSKIIS